MTKKTAQKRPLHKTFVFNLGVIILVCIVLYWMFFSSLSWFTRHGESVSIPQLKGLSLADAERLTDPYGFNLEVDSTYVPGQRPLTVLSQQPDPGFKVKKGHTLFITVNKTVPPTIPMPSLVNLSYRSAVMLLETSKLILKDTIIKPDMAQGAVLEQLYNGQPIKPGTAIPQGSGITLVVGSGMGQTRMNVPNIIGMSYPEAVALLSGSNLNYNVSFDGTVTDTQSAVVYLQSPMAVNDSTQSPNSIQEGMIINFRVRQRSDDETQEQ
ncbi:MAG TPA: PASTA domain-containing protein [Edaphocola sp.]|nr:PASTA domain-containing protein [Edaphocola sp.]